jgi:hypothetical protein
LPRELIKIWPAHPPLDHRCRKDWLSPWWVAKPKYVRGETHREQLTRFMSLRLHQFIYRRLNYPEV